MEKQKELDNILKQISSQINKAKFLVLENESLYNEIGKDLEAVEHKFLTTLLKKHDHDKQEARRK